MAFTVGKYGIHSIGSLGLLILTFYVACSFFVIVILGTLARIHGFISKVLRYFREELLIVLGTLVRTGPASCRSWKRWPQAGVSGLVLPMGYSFNLDGTAIYLTLASLFIAQACDIHLSFGQIAAMLGIMLLTSKGAAGVTGSGFVGPGRHLTVMPDLPVAGWPDRTTSAMSEARPSPCYQQLRASIVVSIKMPATARCWPANEPELRQDRGSPGEDGLVNDLPAR